MAGLFILGGSTFYTLQLLDSLKSFDLLPKLSRIALFGRNEKRLALIAEAGTNLLDDAVQIEVTTDIKDCLDPDFDILFNQIRFGGLQARSQDEKAAIDVGLPADETLGIVGASNAIRAIVGVKTYLETIAQKSSPFTLINFTNPCSIVCQYLAQQLSNPVWGVCDYPAYMRKEIATAMGVPISAIEVSYFGLNHFGFIYGVQLNGQDVFAQVMQKKLAFRPDCNSYFESLLNISWSFVFEPERITARQRAQDNRASVLLSFEGEMETLLESGVRDPGAYLSVLAKRNCDWYNLAVSPTIARLLNVSGEAVYLNCDAGDPFDLGLEKTIVESNVRLDCGQAQPRLAPAALLTSPEYQLVRTMKKTEGLLLDGILSVDQEMIMASCLLNPMIRDLDKATNYFERLAQSDPTIADFWC